MEDLYPDTRKLIEDRIKANESLTGDYEKDLAAGSYKPMPTFDYDFGLQGANDAISRKAKSKFLDPAIANLKTQEMADYAGKVQKKLISTQKLALGQMRYDNARALAAQQRYAQEEAQRAAMVGSLFQLAGTAVGAYFGGPAGAAVGGQLGGMAAGSGQSTTGQFGGVRQANPGGHSGPYMNIAQRTA